MLKLRRIVQLEMELNELRRQVVAAEAPPKEEIFTPTEAPPKEEIFKPTRYWPAIRARNILKEVDPHAPRQNFDKNIRALAQKARTTPQDILGKNPILVGRHLGIREHRLSQIIGDYYKLMNDIDYKSDRQGRW